jgi:serine/threonine-protein kinase
MALPDGQVCVQLPGVAEAYAANQTAAAIMLPIQAPYLAPEISAGAPPSPASDVYAAGVLLYELLTGRLPYNAETPISMALKHATGTVPSVRMYNPSVPAVLDELVKKALSKEPAGRYATAGALLSDLRVLQDALRFGRTVTWPITPESAPPTVESMPRTAPRKEIPAKTSKQKSRREPSDIPLFLWILIAIFGAAAATMLGIWIFFNMSKPTLVKVPTLTGLTIDEALRMVQFSKLDVQVVGDRASEKVPKDHILSSDPAEGEMVREGGHIRVVLSSGSQFVIVPNLKGNTTDQARSILQTAKLTLDENILSQRSETVEAGQVISQTPAAGKKVDQTSRVRITVSSGNGGNGATNIYTLRVTLSKIEAPVTLRVDMTDDLGTETIYEDIHSPEETVELLHRGVGKQVSFKIFYDGELVKEVTQRAEEGTPIDQVNRENQENQ